MSGLTEVKKQPYPPDPAIPPDPILYIQKQHSKKGEIKDYDGSSSRTPRPTLCLYIVHDVVEELVWIKPNMDALFGRPEVVFDACCPRVFVGGQTYILTVVRSLEVGQDPLLSSDITQ